ncbi:MAG: flagellar FliJ family protein [Terriglobales bacterium]
MPFHFPLDAVLRLRQSLERQQELLLREANQQVTALQLRIGELNAQISAHAIQQNLQLASTLSAAELQFLQLCRSVLLGQRGGLEKRLATAQAIQDSRMASFCQARQQREVMETLRQTQMQVYRQDAARRDQRHLDDMLLLRRAYLRRR